MASTYQLRLTCVRRILLARPVVRTCGVVGYMAQQTTAIYV